MLTLQNLAIFGCTEIWMSAKQVISESRGDLNYSREVDLLRVISYHQDPCERLCLSPKDVQIDIVLGTV